jgi:hypothetical protein
MGKMIDQPWFLFGSSESAPETWMVSSDVCHKAENLWAHWSSFFEPVLYLLIPWKGQNASSLFGTQDLQLGPPSTRIK